MLCRISERAEHATRAAYLAKADLVTEMSLVKHPFRDGVKAQKGIEF